MSEVRLCIHRAADTIGGNCIEIAAPTGERIVLDPDGLWIHLTMLQPRCLQALILRGRFLVCCSLMHIPIIAACSVLFLQVGRSFAAKLRYLG
jgi:hypothetical protein